MPDGRTLPFEKSDTRRKRTRILCVTRAHTHTRTHLSAINDPSWKIKEISFGRLCIVLSSRLISSGDWRNKGVARFRQVTSLFLYDSFVFFFFCGKNERGIFYLTSISRRIARCFYLFSEHHGDNDGYFPLIHRREIDIQLKLIKINNHGFMYKQYILLLEEHTFLCRVIRCMRIIYLRS